MFNKDLIDNRFDEYINNLNKIESKPLRNKFINSAIRKSNEGQQYAKNFADEHFTRVKCSGLVV